MSELTGSVVAITGASSGIGPARARFLVQEGPRVLWGLVDHIGRGSGRIERG